MWRDSGQFLTFFGIDGRAMFLLLLVLYRPRLWTLGVAATGMFILILLQRSGYTVPNALRRLRVLATGPLKPAVVGSRRGRSSR